MNTRSPSLSSTLLLGGMLLAWSPTAAAQWRPGPSLAQARYGPGVVRHGGDIYAVGGWGAPNSLEVLYSGGTSWTTLAPLPIGQEGLAAAVVGDRIYTFGSYGWADTCQIYNIASNTWQAGPPVPVGIYWSTAEAVGTDIYLIAGYIPPGPPGTGSDLLFILDTTTNTWSQGASLPVGLQIPASVTHGQFIYVFGSFLHYGVYAYVKYDLVGGTWSTFTGPPGGHGHSSEAVSAGHFVYLIGGSPGNIYTAHQTVEIYDPSSDTWTAGPSLIDGRYQFGAVFLPNEGNIYAVAGRDSNAAAMASVEILTPDLDLVATSESPGHGVVTGSLTLTQSADDQRQQIQEVVVSRRSSLEHEWQIAGVPATGTRTLYVQAHRTTSTDDDEFRFQVRRGKRWVKALTVTKTTDDNESQAFVLPAGVSGTVRIRVIDSNNRKNATAIDSVFVDHLTILVR